MNCKPSKFKSGFSLIELMIVIALIIIMTGVLLVNQNKNKAQQEVESSARQVAAQLRSLQNEALNGKQIENPSGSGTYNIVCNFKFDSPSLDSSITNTGYDISYASCSDGSVISSGTQKIKLNTGKGNVTMNTASVSFSAPWGAVSSASEVTLTDAGNKAYVCVCSSGNIFDTTKDSTCSSC
jgi:prepilin-type N-terminal cleavage/methylation domain-containing protein